MRARFGVELREEIVYLGTSTDDHDLRSTIYDQTRPIGNRNLIDDPDPMSTLLIEGGHRLSGPLAVEGNKNAALPLLAACLLTTEECVLTNVPRISDVEVMARLLVDLGAQVDGIGSTTLRVQCQRSSRTSRTAPWSAGCAGRCCCSARCWRVAAARGWRRPAAIFRRAAQCRRISKRWSRWARASWPVPIISSRCRTA